jgi:pyruvate/2-oxoglutarate dehydrogenase complex dihydrolipoamide acyltransferase (E2) component
MMVNVGTAVAGNAANAAAAGAHSELAQFGRGGEDGYLYCIPCCVQRGFATPHTLGMKYCFMRILFLQFIVCLLRIILLKDYFFGLWMLLTILVGLHAYYESMNMMYISLWGTLCVLNGIFDVVHNSMPYAFGLQAVDVGAVLIRAACPILYFVGASFSYHIYLDYMQATNQKTTMVCRVVPDIFWLMKTKLEKPEDAKLLEQGQQPIYAPAQGQPYAQPYAQPYPGQTAQAAQAEAMKAQAQAAQAAQAQAAQAYAAQTQAAQAAAAQAQAAHSQAMAAQAQATQAAQGGMAQAYEAQSRAAEAAEAARLQGTQAATAQAQAAEAQALFAAQQALPGQAAPPAAQAAPVKKGWFS